VASLAFRVLSSFKRLSAQRNWFKYYTHNRFVFPELEFFRFRLRRRLDLTPDQPNGIDQAGGYKEIKSATRRYPKNPLNRKKEKKKGVF